jgi:hypothetical protein
MPFSRALVPVPPAQAAALTAAMTGIGMRLAAAPSPAPNIEDTLLFAAVDPRHAVEWLAADPQAFLARRLEPRAVRPHCPWLRGGWDVSEGLDFIVVIAYDLATDVDFSLRPMVLKKLQLERRQR